MNQEQIHDLARDMMSKNLAQLRDFLMSIRHSPIKNYGGIPGLTSWLISEPSEKGCVRMLSCSRNHEEAVVPHNHRFDFRCLVLSGQVVNTLWTADPVGGDEYQTVELLYSGEPGAYQDADIGRLRWAKKAKVYESGDQYEMNADQVHSIFFTKGAEVLFFEGPKLANSSFILQPVVDDEVIRTFKVEPWMFKKV